MKGGRENFGSRTAAIMAMAGSAIGLGNIWRFPYMVGENGGAAFVIIYLASTVFLSLPIMLSEMLIGRSTQKGTFGAMEELAPGTRWKWLGLITVVSPLIILSYYSVVGGWSVEFLLKSLTFSFNSVSPEKVPALFGEFISRPLGPLVCHTVFLALTALVVIAGVHGGIEKFSKITMPVLFVLIVLIMIYSVSLPGAAAGVGYLVRPDFSKITPSVVASAVGQSFFSLSLGVGTMLTYGSYLRRDENMLSSGLGTAGFDLLFALMAGFAVMPAVFSAGIAPGAGPGLVFETLPYIFSKMGLGAPWLSGMAAILFFLTILVAALSSSISMLEVGVAYLVEEKHFSRKGAVLFLFACCWILGCICSLNGKVFDFCDHLTSDYLMTFGGLLFTVFVGWKMSRSKVREEFLLGDGKGFNAKCFNAVYFLIRYIAPVVIGIIFVTNLIL